MQINISEGLCYYFIFVTSLIAIFKVALVLRIQWDMFNHSYYQALAATGCLEL